MVDELFPSDPSSGGPGSLATVHTEFPHFVKMTALTMADQLRTVVLNSVQAYSQLWQILPVVGAPAEKQVREVSKGCKGRGLRGGMVRVFRTFDKTLNSVQAYS